MATRIQDVQASVTRTEDVAKLQQAQHQSPQVQQEQLNAQISAEKQVKRQQTQQTLNKEEGKIREESYPSRQRRYSPAQRQKKKSQKAKKEEFAKPYAGANRIDLKA